MFRRLWQSSMIGLARSKRVKAFVQTSRATSFLRDKYVAGVLANEGVARAVALLENGGIRSSLFYMGEYVNDLDLVEENVQQILGIVSELSSYELDIHVSVDPTQIGHQIDPAMVPDLARQIAETIQAAIRNKSGVNCLMFDMEDSTLNDPTIELHNILQKAGYPVALTLQAYLRRTFDDMKVQVARGSRVRLVKGAFAAGPQLAFQSSAEIKDNSKRLIELMFSDQAKSDGFYPIIATHDTNLHDFAIEAARRGAMAGLKVSMSLKCCWAFAKMLPETSPKKASAYACMCHSDGTGGLTQCAVLVKTPRNSPAIPRAPCWARFVRLFRLARHAIL